MKAIEKKVRAELEAEYAEKAKNQALGITRDMGKTKDTANGVVNSKATAS